MSIKFKRGDLVRQVVPAPLEGEIVQVSIVDDDVKYLVESADGTQRWFNEDEVTECKR